MVSYESGSLELPCVLGGRYELQRIIGSGGMGEVYLARHLGLERDVAIKLLTFGTTSPGDEERSKERFRREAIALSRLRHPNTVQVIDFGWTEDLRPYIVTELLTGETLDQVLEREGRLEPSRAVNIIGQMAMSLAEAHQYGVVHRDLKPSNIFLLEAFGTTDFVKVIDFGVARLDGITDNEGRPLTVEGTTLGTPDYMAPEQARAKRPTPATDVYALGCILYEMVTGQPPFLAETALQVMIKHIKEEPVAIAKAVPDIALPPGLEHAVMLMMRKDPEDRPANAGVLLEILKEINKPTKPAMVEMAPMGDLGEFLGSLPDDDESNNAAPEQPAKAKRPSGAQAKTMIGFRPFASHQPSKPSPLDADTIPPPDDLVHKPSTDPMLPSADQPAPPPRTEPRKEEAQARTPDPSFFSPEDTMPDDLGPDAMPRDTDPDHAAIPRQRVATPSPRAAGVSTMSAEALAIERKKTVSVAAVSAEAAKAAKAAAKAAKAAKTPKPAKPEGGRTMWPVIAIIAVLLGAVAWFVWTTVAG